MEWDHFDYRIAGHYLSVMVNGDYSGMTSEECREYRAFERKAFQNAREAGFTVGHWSTESDHAADNWGACDVCGLQAMRADVKLMVYKTESKPA